MCGIAGYIGPKLIDKKVIEHTLRSMKSRGPNNQDFYQTSSSGDNIYLLHSRLSILDLEKRSNQPFIKDNYVLIFNGEIYNYLEIRKKLKNFNHSFKTESDTEVILESYKRYGENCVKYFEGMWAFVIFDINKNRFFFSRDRFGEKPLFYYLNKKSFYFGSEPKFIFSLLGKKIEPNMQQIQRLMYNGFRSIYKKQQTFFADLSELRPASNIILDKPEKFKINKYWNLKFNPIADTLRNIKENLKTLIDNSLKLRLRSDVPIAFCLSGGIDSSTLVSMAKRNGVEVKTFSIIDSDERYDERKNINSLVDSLNLDHININTTSENFFERMSRQIKYFDAPIPTISYYVHNFLTERMKSRGFSVSISGTGADEIFSGYYDHYSYWLASMHSEKNFNALYDQWKNSYGRFVENPLIKDLSNFLNNKKFNKHLYQSRTQFETLFNVEFDETFEEDFYTDDILRNRMINELSSEVVPVILFADDLNSMMYSIENRSPFLDKSLVEYAYTIPSKHLIKDGFPKWLLRNFDDSLLPDKIRNDKRKRGFNTSINSVFDKNNPDFYNWMLKDNRIFEIVNKKNFEKFIDNDFKDNSSSKFIFNFISNKIFLEQYS